MKPDTLRFAEKAIEACRIIAGFSENPRNITRTFLSLTTHQVHEYLRAWMSELGMTATVDAAGNLRGLRNGGIARQPRLVLGSHIDTVPDAGAYDGVLGVVLALILVEALKDHPLGYDIEVIAFSEEEGVRFGVPFIGSRAVVGDLDESLLRRKDTAGVSLAEAIAEFGLDSAELPEALLDPSTFAFLEFHIEQGPVLEDLGLPLGIVEGIAGQSRLEFVFEGRANHAGTTPMHLRRDALAGAAEWITAVEDEARETSGLVATVGNIEVKPGATNVIPAQVHASLDIRHIEDRIRFAAVNRLTEKAKTIAAGRGLALDWTKHFEQNATPMEPRLAGLLEQAVIATNNQAHRMAGGAGHDAMVLATRVPAAMLFLRSPGGVSHHPSESVLVEDVQAAIEAGLYFLKHL